MELDFINKKEVSFIIKTYIKTDIDVSDITNVKHLFSKLYSRRLLNRVLCILRKKIYCLLSCIKSDDYDFLNESTLEIYNLDVLHLYSFNINNDKYYLLFSIVYEKDILGLKKETVEFICKK